MPAEDISHFDVVVSGISGKFPGSDSLEKLKENLFKGVDLISKDGYRRINSELTSVTPYIGKINDLDKFDDSFFGVPYRLAELMDPLTRVLIERAYEAIFDAGINPQCLKETNTAVYTASCISDSEAAGVDDVGQTQYWLLAHIRALLANRISYFLNLNGPSWTIDGSWSGGIQCLKNALHDIRIGRVSAALVGVSNVIISPEITEVMHGLGKLTNSDKSKSFDESADGYVRSEGVVMLLLQRASDAKRSYGTVIHADSIYSGSTGETFLKPTLSSVTKFLENFYTDCGISTNNVVYIEADGSAQKYMDELEAKALADVFCSNDRNEPLLVGSVKSNLGHTEGASCLVSLAKALIALDAGIIPPNAYLENCNANIQRILNDRLKIVSGPTHLPLDGYVGINCFGLSNSIGHVLLKQHVKQKVKPSEQVSTLVIVSARNEQGILNLINKLESVPYDPEYFWLVNEIFKEPVKAHFYKGFSILGSEEKKIHFSLEVQPSARRPVWFVFDGMGCQWPGMGSDLMNIPVFAEAINECHAHLEPLGIDLKNVITSFDPTVLENSVHSFVGIVAIQIGMVDVLKAVGIEPDGMLGHSLGENGCSYADGCFTRYQTIMAAYYRGFSCTQVKLKKGLMVAVGVKYDKLTDLPDDVKIACRNSDESCTISGPIDAVEDYMNELKRQNIFVRKVKSNNIAFHSPLVKPLGDYICPRFRKIIPEPKKRSKRWISSSIEEKNWNSDLAITSSAEYHVNNFLHTVYFSEACKHIPEDAVVIEIAPHGLFQGILKRSLHESCFNIPLGKRESSSPLNFLLSSIGKLYVAGLQPNVNALYSKVNYPVSRGTPSVAEFITWNHEKIWEIKIKKERVKIRPLKINVCNKQHRFIANHKIAGHIVVPIPVLLLRTLIAFEPLPKDLDILTFENVIIHKWPEITVEDQITVHTQVVPASGNFEILENGGNPLINGNVQLTAVGNNSDISAWLENLNSSDYDEDDNYTLFEHFEIYEIFRKNGFCFSRSFSDINKISFTGDDIVARVIWKNDISRFLYALLQVKLFYNICLQEKQIGLPLAFLKFEINRKYFDSLNSGVVVKVSMNSKCNVIWGINFQLTGVRNSSLIRQRSSSNRDLFVRNLRFIPFSDTDRLDLEEFMEICSKIIADSLTAATPISDECNRKLNVYEVDDERRDNREHDLSREKLDIFYRYLREQQIEISTYSFENLYNPQAINAGQTLVMISTNNNLPTNILSGLPDKIVADVFVFFCFDNNDLDEEFPAIITKQTSIFRLGLRKRKVHVDDHVFIVHPEDNKFWLDELEDDLYSIESNEVPVILWHSKYLSQAMNNLENIFQLDLHHKIRIVIVLDGNTDTTLPFNRDDYKRQMEKNLSVNVLKNNQWGVLTYLTVNLFKAETGYIEKLSQNCHRIKGIVTKFSTVPKPNYLSNQNVDAQDNNWIEYSGITEDTGERVMGIADSISLKDDTIVEPILQWPVPPAWSLEEAATVPLTYSKVYYALSIRGNLRSKTKVLVHSGYTNIGEAAIRVSLSFDCNVFTTAYDEDHAQIISDKFGHSKLVHVLILNDDSISTEMLKLTAGRGLDLITNATTEKQIQESTKCLNSYGSFVQLTEDNIKSTTRIGMEFLLKSTNVIGSVGLKNLKYKPNYMSDVHYAMSDGIKRKVVQPLNKEICGVANRLVHRSTNDNNNRCLLNDRTTHLIVGNKCALWYNVVFWLLQQRNAKKIIFAVEDQIENGHQQDRRFDLLLRKHRNLSIVYMSIDTVIQSFAQISECLPFETIFCINTSAETLTEIDLLSRQASFRVKNFICLQSDAAKICESRYGNSLSSFDITWNRNVDDATIIISDILNAVLMSSSKFEISPVIRIDNFLNSLKGDDAKNELTNYLPNLSDLKNIADDLFEAKIIKFERICSLCTEHYKRTQLYPIFVIPGLHWSTLRILLNKIMYPVFCAKLPTTVTSLKNVASKIAELIKEIQPKGPYTLLAETWSGPIAIEVMSLLEQHGRVKINLILLEAIPYDIINYVNLFVGYSEKDLHQRILSHYKALNESRQNLFSMDNERIIDYVNVISRVIHNRITLIRTHNFASAYLHGNITAIKANDNNVLNTLHIFEQTYNRELDLHVVKTASYSSLLSNNRTAEMINSNVLFEW